MIKCCDNIEQTNNLTGVMLCRWVGALSLWRLVPVDVGARYEHPRVSDGENVYLVADDFVQDAIGGSDDQLTQTIDERRRLELARRVDVHQRVTDG